VLRASSPVSNSSKPNHLIFNFTFLDKSQRRNPTLDPEPPRQFIDDLSGQNTPLEASNVRGRFSMSLLAMQGYLTQCLPFGREITLSLLSTKYN
jgi:hypothetical protein